jgi:hypothetical protein
MGVIDPQVHCIYSVHVHVNSVYSISQPWVRILKHILEAERLTFQEELSFQRSESTTGLKQGTVLCADGKDSFAWIKWNNKSYPYYSK